MKIASGWLHPVTPAKPPTSTLCMVWPRNYANDIHHDPLDTFILPTLLLL